MGISSAATISELMENEAQVFEAAMSVIERRFGAEPVLPGALQAVAAALTQHNLRLIRELCQSPIETILFRAVVVEMMTRDDFIIFTGPEGDYWRTKCQRYQGHASDFAHFFESSWHIILQPKLKDVVNGKNIRPDAIAWHCKAKCKGVVVECDGFEFHSPKGVFISDRVRDRALSDEGFHVRRYSGSEIKADPVTAAMDLVDCLLEFTGSGEPTEGEN